MILEANLLLDIQFSYVYLFNRYEGPRNAEALAEFVNKEGGTLSPSSY